MKELFIIAGLGNPGARYEKTRHNVGFDTIDLLSEKYNIKVNKIKHKALLGDGIIDNKKVVLVKPQTFMNLSGESLREVVEWYKVPPENLIVIYDDVDLPVGKVRVRPSGSSGSHNGMKSVIYQLQTDQFPRIRIGIGKAPEGWDMIDHVMGRFSSDERKIIDDSIDTAAEAAVTIASQDVAKAMNLYNGGISNDKS